jgi:hypothetical protein|tara:strand:- start:6888 stop:7304 length:417 start_codon:yes stop_codon:yes gene_type:complete
MGKVQRTWRLPKPDIINGEKIWYPVVRVGRKIPFGYKQDPNDEDILLPIPEQLELYEDAKKHLKKYSYRDVANWLTTQSGRSISYVALNERVNRESRLKKDLANQRYYAQRYKEASDKAKKIEDSIKRIQGSTKEDIY